MKRCAKEERKSAKKQVDQSGICYNIASTTKQIKLYKTLKAFHERKQEFFK